MFHQVSCRNTKRHVYSVSNVACNIVLNDLFSIEVMANEDTKAGRRSIDLALKRAKELGWNQTAFATRMGVLAQDVTNWKARGMPTDKLEEASKVLGRSVDWLLGREAPSKSSTRASWPFSDALYLDYDDLEVGQQIEIKEIVEDRIARFKARNGPKRRRKSAEDRA